MGVPSRGDYGVRPVGLDETLNIIRQIDERVPRQAAKDIAKKAKDLILETTGSGLDSEGKPFIRYSKKYEEVKGLPVNLKLKGDMLRDLRMSHGHKGNVIYAKVYIGSIKQRKKALPHNVGGLSGKRGGRFIMPKRKFMGIRASLIRQEITPILTNVYQNVLNRLRRL